MVFHPVKYPVCSAFVIALCVLARISYSVKSRDLNLSLMVIDVFLLQSWNSLPASLRNADSLNSFKKHLKIYLFHQAFS